MTLPINHCEEPNDETISKNNILQIVLVNAKALVSEFVVFLRCKNFICDKTECCILIVFLLADFADDTDVCGKSV